MDTDCRSQGPRIGWVRGEDAFLLADPSYRVANRLGGEDGLTIGVHMLKKHLKDRKILKSTEKETKQTRYEKRVHAEGARPRALHVSAELIRPRSRGHDDAPL